MKLTTSVFAVCLMALAGIAEAKTVRATDVNAALLSEISKGTVSDTVIEFHQGDQLPVTFTAEGDLLETTQSATSYVGVKRNFWVLVQQNKFQMSLDGVNYKDIHDVLSGSFTAGAGSASNGGVANAINLGLQAYLK